MISQLSSEIFALGSPPLIFNLKTGCNALLAIEKVNLSFELKSYVVKKPGSNDTAAWTVFDRFKVLIVS
jgi:hypothetical protein